jgi:hypothetical protein
LRGPLLRYRIHATTDRPASTSRSTRLKTSGFSNRQRVAANCEHPIPILEIFHLPYPIITLFVVVPPSRPQFLQKNCIFSSSQPIFSCPPHASSRGRRNTSLVLQHRSSPREEHSSLEEKFWSHMDLLCLPHTTCKVDHLVLPV